jgi:hypothetical protein
MNNVHDDQPTIFQTRWCMSYLRGPLTRIQIQQLAGPRPAAAADSAPETAGSAAAYAVPATAPAAPMAAAGAPGSRPALPPDVRQYFLPLRGAGGSGGSLIYRPAALGFAQVGFRDKPTGLQASRDLLAATLIGEGIFPVNWDQAVALPVDVNDLDSEGVAGIGFATLPQAAAAGGQYTSWSKDFAAWVYRTAQLELFRHPLGKAVSAPGESERDFRLRLQQETREIRDQEVEKLRQKYAVRISSLKEKVRRGEQAVEREESQAKQQKMQTAISFGATILSSFLGKKAISASSLGRATTAIRGASRTIKEKGDIDRSKETVETYKQQLEDLEKAFEAEAEALAAKMDPAATDLAKLVLRPAKTDIQVKLLALIWLPYRQDVGGALAPAWD